MLNKAVLGFGAVLMLVLVVTAEPMAKGEVEGRLLKVTGTVTVERDGKTMPARPGMEILGGDIIVTGAKSDAAIDLGSSRIVTVKERSHFAIDESGPERDGSSSAMVYYGVVYVREPSQKQGKQFYLQTPSAVAGVRGTNFGIAVAPDGSSRFAVEEGEISVETDGGGTSTVGVMQEVVIETGDQAKLRVEQFRPERQSLENWRGERLDLILRRPILAVQRLTFNIAALVARGARLLVDTEKLMNQTIEAARKAMGFKHIGQGELYNQQRARIFAMLKVLLPSIRQVVRIDNNITARKRLLNVILTEATAQGSPTPPRQVKMIQDNIKKILVVEDEAQKLHEGRLNLMRVKAPELRKTISDLI